MAGIYEGFFYGNFAQEDQVGKVQEALASAQISVQASAQEGHEVQASAQVSAQVVARAAVQEGHEVQASAQAAAQPFDVKTYAFTAKQMSSIAKLQGTCNEAVDKYIAALPAVEQLREDGNFSKAYKQAKKPLNEAKVLFASTRAKANNYLLSIFSQQENGVEKASQMLQELFPDVIGEL